MYMGVVSGAAHDWFRAWKPYSVYFHIANVYRHIANVYRHIVIVYRRIAIVYRHIAIGA